MREMETILFIDAAITIALLVVHLADYFMSWPQRAFAVCRSQASTDGPHGNAARPLSEPLPYDQAA
jgi:hypothetical protein